MVMVSKLLQPEILELVRDGNWKDLKEVFKEWLEPDIADLLNSLDEKDSVIVFRLLPKDRASLVFSEVEPNRQETIIRSIANQELKELMLQLPPDDRTDIFEEIPGELTQKILNLLPLDERKEALGLLGYPEESVGRLMTPDYVAVRQNWDIEQARAHIRRRDKVAETINIVYVVDKEWKLKGDIPIRKFILAGNTETVETIMDSKCVSITAYDDQELAVSHMKKYNLNILPVVDSNGILLGIVTIDDIIDVLEEEVSEDFHKVAAIVPVEESYAMASVILLYKKRVGWLMLLLVSGFLSSNIIAHFHDALQSVIVLAFFIPVLIGSGGNTASQSSTLIIRAIAVGDLNLARWWDVVKKELVIGAMLGITLGVTLFLRSYFWQGGLEVGLVIGLSMIAVIMWSNLLGSLLPILLSHFHLDPAVISSPLLATLVDATGLLIYFYLAKLILIPA
ncbi:MAG: magnesium transporter [Desulfobacteraceae bacterium]|nr:magnesium transporter [Desulfobacteraceae bacterium]